MEIPLCQDKLQISIALDELSYYPGEELSGSIFIIAKEDIAANMIFL
jgi:hypothetical protein